MVRQRVTRWVLGATLTCMGAVLLFASAGAAPEVKAPVANTPSGSAAPVGLHPIEGVFAPGFEDLSLAMVRKQVNVEELTKIGRDYANAYRITRSTVKMKEPDKFRMDARVGFIHFEYVMSGPRKVIRAPLTKQYDEIGTDPGKRLGPLDAGLVTPGCLIGYEPAEHIGCSTEDGRRVCQYRIRYSKDTDRHELLWIDTERKYVKRRQLYTLVTGKYKLELLFAEPKQIGVVWVPTRIEVRNAEGKLAGVTQQVDLKLNAGLDDDLFKL